MAQAHHLAPLTPGVRRFRSPAAPLFHDGATNAKQAIAFVERHGVVLQAARGPVPSLAEAIAGGPIPGSWWGHSKGKVIFGASCALADSPDVLVCRLVGGRVTYVHRRLWPALVKLASRFRKPQLARVWDEHTASGRTGHAKSPFRIGSRARS